jgi:DNA-binding HxlR family transcriptional regulator
MRLLFFWGVQPLDSLGRIRCDEKELAPVCALAPTARPSMRFIKTMCPRYQAAVEVLGKRWTGLILNVLLEGPQRFCELAGRLEPVSERMLSERLKELESNGILRRHVLPDAPVRVQYELTEKGRALGGVISAIVHWAEDWVEPMQPFGKSLGATAEQPKS